MKDFTFPSGNVVRVQGYEHFCLRDLTRMGIPESDIICGFKQVPRIPYTKSTMKLGHYFPDIFIPSQRKIIEVKSLWTAKMDKNLIGKIRGVRALHFGMELWIYCRLGKLIRKAVIP